MTTTNTPAFLRNPTTFTIFGAVAAFCTYACAYAFRKGITAVTFEGMVVAGISYKIWLITAQVLGYAASKRIGVKVVSEMSPGRRAASILLFIGIAELALLGFALVPAPYNIIFLFLNGLPLGMVYGIMLGFLEGRRQTDALVAGLTASFIFASGFVKTVALTIRADWGVSEFWLPFVTSLLFVPPLLLSVYALTLLPPPTAEDRALRTERKPMDADERSAFVGTFRVGLVLLIASYVLLSAFRDFRDNFGPEILRDAGVRKPGYFCQNRNDGSTGYPVHDGVAPACNQQFSGLCPVERPDASGGCAGGVEHLRVLARTALGGQLVFADRPRPLHGLRALQRLVFRAADCLLPVRQYGRIHRHPGRLVRVSG